MTMTDSFTKSVTSDNSMSSQRLTRYRAMADSARREADRTAGEARNSYLFIAEQWDRLAELALRHTTAPSTSFG